MHIEEELEKYLIANIPDERENKSRDIKIVLNRYGFGNLAWPTLDKIAEIFKIGTRERVRQVVKNNFRKSIKLEQLPVAKTIFEIIESCEWIPIPELRSRLIREGFASQNTTIRGLLNLADDLDVCSGFDLYDSSLKKLKRSEAEFDNNTFLIRKDIHAKLKKDFNKAGTLPGRLGLANFDYLRSEIKNETDSERLIQLIRCLPEVCTVQEQNEDWYLFEDRYNYLINSCEKIYSLTEMCRVPILSRTLENSLHHRSNKYAYPSPGIISQWIENSKWFVVEQGGAKFLGNKKRELRDIENEAVSYLQKVDMSDSPKFRNHLIAAGYKKPLIDKTIFASPLVTIDKSIPKGRTYQLISKAGKVDIERELPENRYQIFKNRLKHLASETDLASETFSRREQSILREWLFAHKDTDTCAVCGEEFSVRALVAAHKKERSLCTGAERVDPHIVFPLCLFGCDFLYEVGMIRIVGGKAKAVNLPEHEGKDKIRARALSGKAIDPRWLKESEAYFLFRFNMQETLT